MAHDASAAFEAFLAQHDPGGRLYGYGVAACGPRHNQPSESHPLPPVPRIIHAIRRLEFTRLTPNAETQPFGITPLDQAGAGLYSEQQLQVSVAELQHAVLSNPHSAPQPASLAAQHRAELVRLTLAMCNASSQEYDVALLSGATAAFKLVAESLPWAPGSTLLHLRATHNSVLGMREAVLRAGGAVQVVDLTQPLAAPQGCSTSSSPAQLLTPCGPPLTRAHAGSRNQSAARAAGEEGDDVGGSCGVRLAVLPHECNFTGQRLDLAVVDALRSGGQGLQGAGPSSSGSAWLVMLDAAKSCSSAPPDLSAHPADLAALSYYKIFGYPTGLGALIVRRAVLPLLTANKPYFGGGTVEASCAEEDWVVRRPGVAGLEDGTPAFTSIAAARHGFAFIRRLGGFPAVEAHTRCLAQHLVEQLGGMRHRNGQPLAVLYGRPTTGSEELQGVTGCGWPGVAGWGPTVAFNLKRPDGAWVGYHEVSRLAAIHGIQLRVGCFCNPGACARYLGLTPAQVRENHGAGHVCWDERDIIGGQPTGAVRVSLGAASLFQDVEFFIRFVRHYFLDAAALPAPDQAGSAALSALAPPFDEAAWCLREAPAPAPPTPPLPDVPPARPKPCSLPAVVADAGGLGLEALAVPGPNSSAQHPTPDLPAGVDQAPEGPRLVGIYVYPIKSCGSQQVERWPVGPTGLLYDREWALVDDHGKVVTQKTCPRTALVTPHIDLTAGTLTLTAPSTSGPLIVPLDAVHASASGGGGNTLATVTVCGDDVCGSVLACAESGASVRAWFDAALGVPCLLMRQRAGQRVARAGTAGTGKPATRNSPGGAHSTPAAASAPAIGFANDGQFLLVSAASVRDVNARMASVAVLQANAPPAKPVELLRFRPNLVVDGLPAYEEDAWKAVQVGSMACSVLGTCPRCEVLQVDQTSGTRGRADVLLALAQYRRFNGRMHFGILLAMPGTCASSSASLIELRVGDCIQPSV